MVRAVLNHWGPLLLLSLGGTITVSTTAFLQPFAPIRRSSLLYYEYLDQLKTTSSLSFARTEGTALRALQQQEEEQSISSNEPLVDDEITRLRKQAERMRLEAEKDEAELTLKKISSLESKLGNPDWLKKNPSQEEELRRQLDALNARLNSTPTSTTSAPMTTTTSSSTKNSAVSSDDDDDDDSKSKAKQLHISAYEPETSSQTSIAVQIPPLAGFDDKDLDLYIPVARDIDSRLTNATVLEKLEAFRTAPELQDHFQKKIQDMLVGPLEEMQRLEMLKSQFLDSTSSKERESLKRAIEKLEKESSEKGSPVGYSDTVYLEGLPPLTEEDMDKRVEAVGSLPESLVALYLQRNGLELDGDLRLAVQLDYYDPQLQLMDQVRFIDPLPDDLKQDFIKAYDSLPPAVQERFVLNQGIEEGVKDAGAILEAISESEGSMKPFLEVFQSVSGGTLPNLPEYDDIEYVDRSRYLREFYPSIANMEGNHPSQEDVDLFVAEVLDKKAFMVQSKPERVSGGYYIRGLNLLEGDENGSRTAADKLVETISEKLSKSPLADKLSFFYILDPSPPTDEEIEMGGDGTDKPLIVLTTKDRSKFYQNAKPLTKLGVTFSGMFTSLLFSVGSCALNPAIADRFSASLDQAEMSGVIDIEWLTSLVLPVFTAMAAIQIAHEAGHRVIAWKDKFEIGAPNIIPSIQTGYTGAITPLRSPPPSMKSLFDFGIIGPVAGLAVSMVLLINGLQMTALLPMGTALPVIPVDVLRASTLGGGLVEFFLGKNILMEGQPVEAVVEMHPFAVAGFIGLLVNSLALLPLGNTDGGRVAVAMFGRRGAYVVKTFTTLLLCVSGLFGLDQANIFLTYALFTAIWQRELETPTRNEADELDFARGLVGIFAALLVGLTLIPMS